MSLPCLWKFVDQAFSSSLGGKNLPKDMLYKSLSTAISPRTKESALIPVNKERGNWRFIKGARNRS